MMTFDHVILASTSPFRQKLIATSGLTVGLADPGVDELALRGENPKTTAIMRASAKAEAVLARYPRSVVIGADQTLALGERTFTKARSPEEAMACLEALAGRTHFLHSAVALATSRASGTGLLIEEFLVTIPMKMRPLSSAEIRAYVALGEWRGSVGSYQVENVGANLFASIGGETTAIMGLPMAQLLEKLRGLGINPLLNPTGPWQAPSRSVRTQPHETRAEIS